MDQWLEDSARFDFSIGLRLHGNMAAWQAGTPAIWIYHDSRTRELCETMALPHMQIAKFLEMRDVDEMKEKSNFDWQFYKERKSLLSNNLKSVFMKHGVSCKLQ